MVSWYIVRNENDTVSESKIHAYEESSVIPICEHAIDKNDPTFYVMSRALTEEEFEEVTELERAGKKLLCPECVSKVLNDNSKINKE